MLGVPKTDPTAEFKYRIEIEGITEAMFTECSGLSIERDTSLTYEEGGRNDYVHVLPGRIKQSKITLKRGVTFSRELWHWFAKGLYDGKVDRRNVSILLYARDGRIAQRWDLDNAYPTKWMGPTFKSDSARTAVETLDLVYHGFKLGDVASL